MLPALLLTLRLTPPGRLSWRDPYRLGVKRVWFSAIVFVVLAVIAVVVMVVVVTVVAVVAVFGIAGVEDIMASACSCYCRFVLLLILIDESSRRGMPGSLPAIADLPI